MFNRGWRILDGTQSLVLNATDAVDLHLHTYVSDGLWSPSDLVDRLIEMNIRVGAVCDHDNQRSVREAIDLGARRGVTILPGIEMTVRWDDRQWHMLVYGIAPDDKRRSAKPFHKLVAAQDQRFQELALDARRRIERSGRPIPSLQELEIHGPLMPVHVLRALITDGHTPSLKEAAELVVELGGHFTTDTPIAEVVRVAHRAGGVCVIAHPGRADLGPALTGEQLDRLLKETEVDGLEGHYRTYTDDDTDLYRTLATGHDLVIGTGSDSHGPGVPVDPRPFQARWSRGLLERLGIEVECGEGPDWERGMDPLNVKPKKKSARKKRSQKQAPKQA